MNLLNLYECAEELQINAGWLKENAISGKIPYLRIGKRDMRFNLDAVRKALFDLARWQNQLEPTDRSLSTIEHSLSLLRGIGFGIQAKEAQSV